MSTARPHAVSPAPNIVLTGFMGTGKTTVGRLIADRLGRRYGYEHSIRQKKEGDLINLLNTQTARAIGTIS